MEKEDSENLKKIIITLKALDFTESDIQRIVKMDAFEIRKIVKNFDII